MQLPGVTLPAGTYIFEVVNPNGGSDVVIVRSRDRSKVYLMQFTRAVYRPQSRQPEGDRLRFGETPAGTPPPVKAWFPEGETRGREFIY